MDISNFVTAQEIIPFKYPLNGTWVISIDIGFSSVKGFCPNSRFCFPSYAKKLDSPLRTDDPDDIYYRDDTGLYLVGINAQEIVTSSDTNDTRSLFDRNRYFTKDFQIFLRTAYAIGLMENTVMRKASQMPVFIQTGLPAAYLKEDASKIRAAFTTPGKFEIKLGTGKWRRYDMALRNSELSVMSQPAGTLNSIMVSDDGAFRENARQFMAGNILIADAGFGTFDPYGVINRKVALQESIDNLGMKRILEKASEKIYKDYHIDIRIPQMRKYIRAGYFKRTDIRRMKSEKIMLAPYIDAACESVAAESLEKLYDMAGFFQDYDILVLTGGTGAAYLPYYKKALSEMDGLTIIAGNDGNELPIYYANARGYYMTAFRNKAGGRT